MTKKQKKRLIRIILAAALTVLFRFLPLAEPFRLPAFLIPYLIIGYDILIKAGKGLLHGQPFDENFLMAAATVGAMALGEPVEAAAVMLFYQIGELFQSVAVGKSRRSIAALMDVRPDHANVEREDGRVETVDPDGVPVGSILVVRPGEKVPIDGVVVEGVSTVNTAALTGESLPREVSPTDEVSGGFVNMTGLLRVRTVKAFGESTVSKILELVENAAGRKAKSEQFISKFARVYTPCVCIGAVLLALVPPLTGLLFGFEAPFADWLYRALTFLVISCPCALVISIPLSFFAGLGGASSKGILIKGSNYMETLAGVDTAAFDKTGTVTKGVFEVQGIHHGTMPDDELLELAALAESASLHPIALGILRAYGKESDRSRVTGVKEIGGHGVSAEVDGRAVAVGNDRLMSELGVAFVPCHGVGTVVHVAVDGVYAGHLLVADVLKPTAKRALDDLKALGIRKTVMLTGDGEAAAKAAAKELAVDEVRYGLMPADKVAAVEKLAESAGKLAFIGDGINDAPVLARADVGIAMGALGSDAAIEAADVVLMDDDPAKVAAAVRIARKCMRIVYENIWFAIGVKVLCLILGAAGIAGMWLAIFADVGVMVLAVLNAVRALKA